MRGAGINGRISRLAILLAGVAGMVLAQSAYWTRGPADGTTPPVLAPGAPAGSYSLSGFERINTYTGHLNLSLPLLQIGGRGDVGFRMMATIDAPRWTMETATNVQDRNATGSLDYQHSTSAVVAEWTAYSAGYGPGMLILKRIGDGQADPQEGRTARFATTFTYVVFLQPDGSELALYDKLTGGSPTTYSDQSYEACRGTDFVARDGSAATFVSAALICDDPDPANYPDASETADVTGNLYFADGTRYAISGGLVQSIRDRNGNTISFSYHPGTYKVATITDAAGRVTTIAYGVRTTALGSEDEISFPGAGGAPRPLVITRANPRSRLRPGIPDPGSLFPNAQTTISGPFDRIVRIVLPNSKFYDFFYTPWGEVARVVLPTGGVIEYDHGPGLAGAGTIAGVDTSGQVLDAVPGIWQTTSESLPPPPWQPYVYRRLLARREYPNGGVTADLVQTHALLETATGSYTNSLYGNRVHAVSVTAVAYAEVTDSGTDVAAITRRHYFHTTPRGVPALESIVVGPSAELSNRYPRYTPDPFEGKEYRTETVGFQRVDRIHGVEANGAGLVCQENTTFLQGNNTTAQVFRYDRDLNGVQIAADKRFGNLTDVYEYGFGAAPAVATANNGVDY